MTRSQEKDRLRALPSVDSLVRHEEFGPWLAQWPREFVVRVIQDTLATARAQLTRDKSIVHVEAIRQDALSRLQALGAQHHAVINATGVVLHTNLGRAPLSEGAVAAMRSAAGYCNLEYDLLDGMRSSRQEQVGALLRVLTGAEAAFVTVNNAAAVLLALTVVARGMDVLVSRGQSVEIGGNFRIPDILEQSGASLVDVGTTNRTRISDYEKAITDRSAAVLHVHASNFRIVGFTAEPSIPELVSLCRSRDMYLLIDNGSGALLDTAKFGLAHEPMPEEMLASGASLIAFSGDKLLGGPQCGILVGSSVLISRLAVHPLARAFRPDKVTLAGLTATLQSYLRGDATRTIPIWQIIVQSGDDIRARALAFQQRAAEQHIHLGLESGHSTIGGGAIPGSTLPTTLLTLPPEIRAEDLRTADFPVVPRSQHGQVHLDLRTVMPAEEKPLLDVLRTLSRRQHRTLDLATQ